MRWVRCVTVRRSFERHAAAVRAAIAGVLIGTIPEHGYHGEGSYHGYAASTPTADGERLYVFFGQVRGLLLRPRRQ
jgi:hypothetical protein